VLFKRYEGHIHERGGKNYRLLEDKALVAIIDQPAALAVAA
jgi:co-chaperonin GroES (HSP10)